MTLCIIALLLSFQASKAERGILRIIIFLHFRRPFLYFRRPFLHLRRPFLHPGRRFLHLGTYSSDVWSVGVAQWAVGAAFNATDAAFNATDTTFNATVWTSCFMPVRHIKNSNLFMKNKGCNAKNGIAEKLFMNHEGQE